MKTVDEKRPNPALTQTGLSPEGKSRDFLKFGYEQSHVRVKPAQLVTPTLGGWLLALFDKSKIDLKEILMNIYSVMVLSV